MTDGVRQTVTDIQAVASRIPRHGNTVTIHVAVNALARTSDPQEMRAALKRAWTGVDKALADDPLLQLEALLVRLRRQLGR